MKKRQIKKNEKKHVKLYADEAPLLFMTAEERQSAYKAYSEARNKLARKRYRVLKNMKPMVYFFPVGKRSMELFGEMAKRGRKTSTMLTQSLKGTSEEEIKLIKKFLEMKR